MRTMAVNSDNDIYLDSNGNLAISEGLEAAAQGALHAARTDYKEVPLDMQRGIPYLAVLLGERPNIGLFEQFLRQEVERLPYIKETGEFTANVKNGTMSYELEITTDFGETSING
ncbi:MAG: hypothetical protein J6Z08_00650 [Elusimicrobiales bacterium]|nr:hypothetical protein [Elusimicrobiales bacterium]